MIILETRNDGIRFTCPPLRSHSEEYLDIMGQYNSTQEALVQEVLQIAGKIRNFFAASLCLWCYVCCLIAAGYVDPLRCLGDYLARLDVFCRFVPHSFAGCSNVHIY